MKSLLFLVLAAMFLPSCGDQSGSKDCYPNNGGCIGPQHQDPPADDAQAQ